MRRHVNNIIAPTHYMNIPPLIHHSRVPSIQPLPIKPPQVPLIESPVILKQRRKPRRRKRHPKDNIPHRPNLDFLPFIIHNPDIKPGHRLPRATRLNRQRLMRLPILLRETHRRPQRNPRHRTPALRAPPIINHTSVRRRVLRQQPLVQRHDTRLAALPSQEQRSEMAEPAPFPNLAKELILGVLLPYRAQRRRRREQTRDFILLNDPPEGARVRCPYGLPLVENGRRASQQRRVHDEAVADDPADVAGREEHVARALDVEDVFHREVEPDGVAAGFAEDALGETGRPGCVDDVQPIGAFDGDTGGGEIAALRVGDEVLPEELTGGFLYGVPFFLLALPDDGLGGFERALLDGALDEGPVVERALRAFDRAASGHNDFGAGGFDALREGGGCEASEDDGVEGTQPYDCEHSEDGGGDHGHVDEDDVALLDALLAEHASEGRDFGGHLRVGVGLFRVRDGGVPDQSGDVAVAGFDVAVEAVVCGADLAIGEPGPVGVFGSIFEGFGLLAEDFAVGFVPVELLAMVVPELFGVGEGGALHGVLDCIVGGHGGEGFLWKTSWYDTFGSWHR
jgi:hypothetical protein